MKNCSQTAAETQCKVETRVKIYCTKKLQGLYEKKKKELSIMPSLQPKYPQTSVFVLYKYNFHTTIYILMQSSQLQFNSLT